ncbi:hypothetical protein GOBAR_AA11075 [Gossypium barbadense]|uniref:SWIM-type domain-containing protein n=1 Tax=Gossypium barbadense TaxID=3634 RepID=A0A2P5Y1V4_GOSBA|nr:hypothetical protein GOBAR_AA11075 [Gossypium barbadense]
MTNNGKDSDQDVEDFSDPDVDEVLDDINNEGPEEVEDVHCPSFSNPSHGIILRNELGGDMLNVNPNAAHASEFPEYADIVHAHKLAVNSQFEELFIGQQFENKADCVFAIKQYNMKLSIDYNVVKSTPTLYVGKCWRADDGFGWRIVVGQHGAVAMGQCFDERYRYGQMTTNLVKAINSVLRWYIVRRSEIPLRSYRVDLRNRQCECGMFQTLRYPCAHVVAACATYSLNVEQYIDNFYTLDYRSLHKRVKGRLKTMRVQNGMDIREQVDPKRCTICRTVGHNRSKCPYGNVYTDQSSRSERN